MQEDIRHALGVIPQDVNKREVKMRKKKPLISLCLSLILLFSLHSCKSPASPEVLKRATISISLSSDPVVFIWNSFLGVYVGAFDVIIAETNGVGCTISTVKAQWLHSGILYDSATLEGGHINAYGTLRVSYAGVTILLYDQIRITVQGGDDNGYNISQYKDFNISYI